MCSIELIEHGVVEIIILSKFFSSKLLNIILNFLRFPYAILKPIRQKHLEKMIVVHIHFFHEFAFENEKRGILG